MIESSSKPYPSISVLTRDALVLLAVGGVLFFGGLGHLPLLEPDEGRNAEVAREMLASGDWVTPHFNSLTYLDKPAVFFWLVAGSFKLAGVSEWAARLPSALAALGAMLLTWFLARKMFGDRTGLRAAVIFASCPLVIALSRLVIFDMTFTFLVTLAMVGFWLGEAGELRSAKLQALSFAAIGLATITKGPVGFLLPLLSLLVYYSARQRLGEFRRRPWVLGLGVFLVVALPWFIAVSWRNPDFPLYAFWEESLLRFATGAARRQGNIFYYVPVFLVGFLPWSFFLLFAGWNRLRRWRELQQDAQKPVLFLLAWAGVIFVFFSLSQSKLPAYFLPTVVPLSILMATVWPGLGREAPDASGAGAGPNRRPDWLTAGFAAMIALGLLVAASPQLLRFGSVQARLAGKLSPAVQAYLPPSLLYSGLILLALGIVGRNLASRASRKLFPGLTFVAAALTVPFLVVRWIVPLNLHARSSSSRELAQKIQTSPEKDLPVYGYYCFRTSLGFYLERPVGLVTKDAGEMTSNYVAWRYKKIRQVASRKPEESGPNRWELEDLLRMEELLIDSKELAAKARPAGRGQPFLVLARNREVSKLAQTVERMEPLWSGSDYSVWKVSPRQR